MLGKFMPLHKGHELLLRFADAFVDKLYVIVDRPPNESVSRGTRCRWIQETLPHAHVIHLSQTNPQAPEEHPDFWNIWKHSILSALPAKPDYLFASEQYGFRLAQALDAQYIPFDLNREAVAISATRIRENLYDNWDFLADAAKPDFLMRVCVFGPESTGKSTLARQLAEHYKTVWVPEYARLHIETKGEIMKEDMIPIALGQAALEETLAPKANRILFCDTEPLATSLWSTWLFGECPAEIHTLTKSKNYDLYLLTDIDLPWVADKARYFPDKQEEFMDACVKLLETSGRPYRVISGTGSERLKNAIDAVSEARPAFFGRQFK